MRKLVCFVVTALLILQLFGCDASSNNDHNNDSVVFYYIHNEIEYGTNSGVITSTVANVNVTPDNYDALLTTYFNGPTNYDCVSPFPAGTTMEEFSIDGKRAQILLSPHMATAQDSALTVALACLTRTVIEMTGVSTVQIRIHNGKIYGEDSVTFSLNSFDYCDDIMPTDSR